MVAAARKRETRNQPDDDLPLGPSNIARLLGYPPSTVWQWRARGYMPEPDYPDVGGRPAWKAGALMRWAKETGRDGRISMTVREAVGLE
jgi:hypothetical protein